MSHSLVLQEYSLITIMHHDLETNATYLAAILNKW